MDFSLRSLFTALILTLAATSTAAANERLRADSGYVGRIKLQNDLDDPRGYCLDVPGPATNLLLHIPVWAHTCHAGAEPDQVFRFNEDGAGWIRFVFQSHDLCLTANDAVEGTRFRFSACGDSARQAFDATAEGTLVLRGTDLCLVVANMTDGGSQDEAGLGRQVRATHMVRGLRLRPCGQGAPEMARWIPIVE